MPHESDSQGPENKMGRTLYAKLIAVARADPTLQPYLRALLGGCCRHPTDTRLAGRIQAFVAAHPQFNNALAPLLPSAQ